ncbi:Ribokinase-like protein [Xylona heveae TC161]|uniref:pyridoxal kinase n=1 Tax=Xylona heveae (strain CBS 132557 / TC161) TaxID=1328760 RepID=A0A165J8W5_XYLHT|nr:Ribokinase-like protein [Xylona heveae TC161]KZF25909.1 Ribokinase-like protein [Xylona heveae TC161]
MGAEEARSDSEPDSPAPEAQAVAKDINHHDHDHDEFAVPDTRVLAVASHVVFGYVGNTMATFVMQSLGCEVAALNTVHFSNHTGYRHFRGTRATAEEMRDIYDGLKHNYLNEFDMMLSGYVPGAEAVMTVGAIARDLRLKFSTKPGGFFWVLDPVMGDQGKLYVGNDVLPAYKNILRDADLILPNQFEAEIISGIKITDFSSLKEAISVLHFQYMVPHVVVTSISFDSSSPVLSVVGSTLRSDRSPRIFRIDVPAIDCFFSGTGDMFAALMVVRLREAATAAGLTHKKSWISPDDVEQVELPLAKAAEKVLSSMQSVLEKTKIARDKELEELGGPLGALEREKDSEKRLHLRHTKAAEIRLVRNVKYLREPEVKVSAVPLDV